MLTVAQATTLRTILASGGRFLVGMGRLHERGGVTYRHAEGGRFLCVNKRALCALIDAGLVEARSPGQTIQFWPGVHHVAAFVSAAGCAALHEHNATLSTRS